MIFYVSDFYKRWVTRNNGVTTKPPKIFNHTVDTLELSIVDSKTNQLLPIPSGQYYLVGSFIKRDKATPIFLSTDYSIDGNVLSFNYSTYTYEFLNLIIGENVQIAIEIGYTDDAGQHVILQDYALASQRYYVEGMPDPTHVSEYYTKSQTDAAIIAKITAHNEDPDAHAEIISGLATTEYVDEAIAQIEISGYVTDEEFEEGMASKQDKITNENKLAYSLLSGIPTIPTQLSQLTNDTGFVNSNDVIAALEPYATTAEVQHDLSGKADKSQLNDYQKKITSDAKLAYDLLSGTPTIPTKTSDLDNDMGYQTAGDVAIALEPYALSSDVQTALSSKADKSQLADYQEKITNEHRLSFNLLSSVPLIPTRTSELENDMNFQTGNDVQSAISGKADKSALNDYQKKITSTAKLDYALLSGTPTIPTEVSQLTNDMGYQTAGDVAIALEPYALKSELPSAVSELTNDSGYATSAYVDGKVATKQDQITNENKLAYDLISGAPAGGASEWGDISGTLSAQTDLQDALDLKADKVDLDIVEANLISINDVLEELINDHDAFYIQAVVSNSPVKIFSQGSPSAIHLKYKINDDPWSDYTIGDEIILPNAGDKVFFKGNDGYFSQSSTNRYMISGNLSNDYNVGGNILGLMDSTFEISTVPEYGFAYLMNYIKIKDAKNLIIPNVTMSPYSCAWMFSGQYALLSSPKIMAAPLAQYCYLFMMANCSSLQEVTVGFTEWGNAEGTGNWLYNAPASGTFYCPSALGTNDTITRGASNCPEGWTVMNI